MLHNRRSIGSRDRLIQIVQPVRVSGVSKGPTITSYELIADDPEPYAAVRNKLGAEVVQNDEITHVQQTVFNIRYREDITTDMSIIHNGKRYKIYSFAESGEVRMSSLDITGEYVEEFALT
jgi:SPP1 family predicted phage head-tail adaptor